MRKLFYIANIRFPTERAHGIQVAHMCSAFSRQGVAVTLLVPDRATLPEDPYAYYGVERTFVIEKIPVPDIVQFGKAGFLIESLIFVYRATRRVRNERETAIYTREELPFLFLPRGRAFYEAHQLRRSSFFKWLIRRAQGVIAITQGLKTALVAYGISENRILVAHDGYDDNTNYETDTKVRKGEVRRRLGLPQDGKIAMYIGGLEAWKGSQTLLAASGALQQFGVRVAIISGNDQELVPLRKTYPHVFFLGYRPYRELACNQHAADVLVIPTSERSELGSRFSSPLKLFAHMASGTPIVASRLPSLTEVLSEQNAYLVEPDNPSSFASGVLAALRNPAESVKRAEKATADVAPYSWHKRAKSVLAYIQCHSEKESS